MSTETCKRRFLCTPHPRLRFAAAHLHGGLCGEDSRDTPWWPVSQANPCISVPVPGLSLGRNKEGESVGQRPLEVKCCHRRLL